MARENNPLCNKKLAANSERLVRSRPILIASFSAWAGSDLVIAWWRNNRSGEILLKEGKKLVKNKLSRLF